MQRPFEPPLVAHAPPHHRRERGSPLAELPHSRDQEFLCRRGPLGGERGGRHGSFQPLGPRRGLARPVRLRALYPGYQIPQRRLPRQDQLPSLGRPRRGEPRPLGALLDPEQRRRGLFLSLGGRAPLLVAEAGHVEPQRVERGRGGADAAAEVSQGRGRARGAALEVEEEAVGGGLELAAGDEEAHSEW